MRSRLQKLLRIRRPFLDKYHAAGRRKRQEIEKTVNDNQNKMKKKRNDTTPNSTMTQHRAYDSEAQLRDVLNAKILQPGFNHEEGGHPGPSACAPSATETVLDQPCAIWPPPSPHLTPICGQDQQVQCRKCLLSFVQEFDVMCRFRIVPQHIHSTF